MIAYPLPYSFRTALWAGSQTYRSLYEHSAAGYSTAAPMYVPAADKLNFRLATGSYRNVSRARSLSGIVYRISACATLFGPRVAPQDCTLLGVDVKWIRLE